MSDPSDMDDVAAKAPYGIATVARTAGVSSRTLRHYEAVGLLPPTAIGDGGVRRYDDRALVRLQRILLLRERGLGLPAIRALLDEAPDDDAAVLATHVAWLERERDRLARQLAAVRTTVARLERGEVLEPAGVFDGFAPLR